MRLSLRPVLTGGPLLCSGYEQRTFSLSGVVVAQPLTGLSRATATTPARAAKVCGTRPRAGTDGRSAILPAGRAWPARPSAPMPSSSRCGRRDASAASSWRQACQQREMVRSSCSVGDWLPREPTALTPARCAFRLVHPVPQARAPRRPEGAERSTRARRRTLRHKKIVFARMTLV